VLELANNNLLQKHGETKKRIKTQVIISVCMFKNNEVGRTRFFLSLVANYPSEDACM